jgi:tRNA nucleotidyltransferase (CCA-adding enzyme)
LLERLPEQIKDVIKLCSRLAKEMDYKVYLVGGFVRDLVLGVKNFDLDIVVEGDGIEFAKRLSEKLNTKFIYHKRFGTATVIKDKKFKVDIATARKETYEYPASLPKVSFGDINDDLARRDFTINSMAVDISEENYGKLIDPFCGKKDLKKGLIRILHPLSFIDDPTRILRAIRFKERFNFKFEKETLRLLKEAVKKDLLEKVGPHRLRDELILILKEASPIKYIYRIKRLCGFKFIHPKILLKSENLSFLKRIEKKILWFKENLPKERELDSWLIYFIALLDPLDKKQTNFVLRAFAFRKGERKRIISYKERLNPVIERLRKKNLRPSQIFKILHPLSYEVIILISSQAKDRIVVERIEDFLKIYNKVRISFKGGS